MRRTDPGRDWKEHMAHINLFGTVSCWPRDNERCTDAYLEAIETQVLLEEKFGTYSELHNWSANGQRHVSISFYPCLGDLEETLSTLREKKIGIKGLDLPRTTPPELSAAIRKTPQGRALGSGTLGIKRCYRIPKEE